MAHVRSSGQIWPPSHFTPLEGSVGQFADELCGLFRREGAPVWLTQQTDELLSMGTRTPTSGEIVQRPRWY